METTDENILDKPDGEPRAESACPLSLRQQNRNLVLFGINKSLTYLAAPVVYVGNLDAILLNKLGYSDTVANLPASAYLWTTAPFLVLFTWYFCRVRMLKPVLVASYAVLAAAGLLVAIGLLRPESNWLVGTMIARATLMGWCLGVVGFYEWEVLARGVAEQRRGLALSLAFGLGPVLAVLGSLSAQLVLNGNLGSIVMGKLAFPREYLVLFIGSTIIMALPMFFAACYIVPAPTEEIERLPLIPGVFGGLRDFLKNRLLMLTTLALLLMILACNTILPSVVLYAEEAIGEEPQRYAGYQFALRFGFKAAVGVILGWMLTKTYPRAGLTATTGLGIAGLLWALCVPEAWYLVSFGLLGAGELYYVYYQNYLISSSPKSRVRPNLAYANLLALPVALGPVLFGMISDTYGLRVSIEAAVALLFGTILLVQFALPRRPIAASMEHIGNGKSI